MAAAKRASEISRIPLSQLKKRKGKRGAGPTPVEGAAVGEEKRAAVSTPVEEAAVGEECSCVARCALAMHQASVSEPDEATGDLGSEEMPRWSQVPKYSGFKTERIRGRNNKRWATLEQQMAQCQEYGKYLAWARNKCGLTLEEFESLLQAAASTGADCRGTAGLPLALQVSRRTYGELPHGPMLSCFVAQQV